MQLPNIAPKKNRAAASRTAASHGSSDEEQKSKMPMRMRLPPRSRTGLKCDEGHPKCDQCARLGHECDYSPRLSFRDDTARVVERMQEVSIAGSAVWDPTSPLLTASSPSAAGGNTLPPFASLTSDVEREMKAEISRPGTYHVVVNPDSFVELPEYAEGATDRLSPPNKDNIDKHNRKKEKRSLIKIPSPTETEDPNVVILPRFEEADAFQVARHPSPRTATRSSPTASKSGRRKSPETPRQRTDIVVPVSRSSPPYSIPELQEEDVRLLRHFRRVVWTHLVQTAPQYDTIAASTGYPDAFGTDIFEQEAATFRPLFHAVMAVSALSLSHQEQGQSIAALQHYQQTLPFLQTGMRSHQDLSSDGVFLTHFLLLVYEIAAAEPGGSNLWSHHLERLLRIIFMRREVFDKERYPFVIWWVCCIDLYALFSGAGTGEFVTAMLENDTIPPPNCHLYPLAANNSDIVSLIYPEERSTLPLLLRLNHDIFLLATRLGLLASRFRQEQQQQQPISPSLATSGGGVQVNPHELAHARQKQTSWAKELFAIQQSLRHLWESSNISVLEQQMERLPRRSKEQLQHASTLYHACLLYSYTSMWPSQRLGPHSAPGAEIEQRASSILRVGADIVINSGRFDLRFIVFPVFMAGVTSSSSQRQQFALDLIAGIERNGGVGRNVGTTRHVLNIVYQRRGEGYGDVDWMEIMREQGLQMVNFGL
ncbi:hypothetical protein AJ80_07361 [Polytolypa hystricis UAMH7299]|uniref:Zn(2)-C6 fungal-type domain-containing protein n=1 Tax=Polytolypa hystricis (strain UAMH7299) TaxID=1447883 RepID=A0A2B7XPD8_POLH7|nr:hypothetical protein AJ80_07361 [Polytolypa hystricis UAMH7299]